MPINPEIDTCATKPNRPTDHIMNNDNINIGKEKAHQQAAAYTSMSLTLHLPVFVHPEIWLRMQCTLWQTARIRLQWIHHRWLEYDWRMNIVWVRHHLERHRTNPSLWVSWALLNWNRKQTHIMINSILFFNNNLQTIGFYEYCYDNRVNKSVFGVPIWPPSSFHFMCDSESNSPNAIAYEWEHVSKSRSMSHHQLARYEKCQTWMFCTRSKHIQYVKKRHLLL